VGTGRIAPWGCARAAGEAGVREMTQRAPARPFLTKRAMQRLMVFISIGMLAVMLAGEVFFAATPVSAALNADVTNTNSLAATGRITLTSSNTATISVHNGNGFWTSLSLSDPSALKLTGGDLFAHLNLLAPDADAQWSWHFDPSHSSSLNANVDLAGGAGAAMALNILELLLDSIGLDFENVGQIVVDIVQIIISTLESSSEYSDGVHDILSGMTDQGFGKIAGAVLENSGTFADLLIKLLTEGFKHAVPVLEIISLIAGFAADSVKLVKIAFAIANHATAGSVVFKATPSSTDSGGPTPTNTPIGASGSPTGGGPTGGGPPPNSGTPACTNAPSLASPGDGQTVGRTVTLAWNAPSSCTPAGYTLHINQSPDPEGAPIIKDTGVGPTSFQYTFPQDGTYYWHVRACSVCTPYKPGPWATGRVVVSASSGGGVVCSPDPNAVTLYNDGGFSSGCHSYGVGEYGSLGYGLDGQVSSIQDPSGQFHITLFDQPGLRGTPGYFDSDTSQLTGYWNDRAQSMRIEKNRPTACNPGADGIIDYIGTNYADGCLTVTGDIPDLAQMNMDHTTNSLRFKGSFINTTQILLYKQANYQDLCGSYWQDQSDLRGCAGSAVSVQVRPFTPPTPVPTQAGQLFSGNVIQPAYLYPSGTDAVRDGDLSTAWSAPGGPEGMLSASWPAPVTIHRIVAWGRGSLNSLQIAFSDGTGIQRIDMIVAGPDCADVTFPDKTVTWVEVTPVDASVNNGFKEVEIWASTGQQYSNNTCVNPLTFTPQAITSSPPLTVATSIPGTPAAIYKDLVVSTAASESSDGLAHTAANPYLIPLDAVFNSVTIKSGAFASTSAWNGNNGGVARFTAKGIVLIDGTLTVDGKGYRGGPVVIGADEGKQGESYTGTGGKLAQPNGGGGGGGSSADSGGGGGGYGNVGSDAPPSPNITATYGGASYGDPTLKTLYLGSGGGSAGAQSAFPGGAGGSGGGAISITAGAIVVHGRISANGADGGSAGNLPSNPRGGGGGSGGSILLHADTLDIGANLVTATGGQGGYGVRDSNPDLPATGGNGSEGRIRIEYRKALSGSVGSPTASVAQYAVTSAPSRDIDMPSKSSPTPSPLPLPPSPAPPSRTTTGTKATPNPLPPHR
jgi:hypothetical protein